MTKYFILMAFMMAPMVVTAGIIAPDGNEWELRGSATNVAGHSLEAATDMGWMWASLDDWSLSGLAGTTLIDADLDAFEGICDGTGRYCLGFLSAAGSPPDIHRHALIAELGAEFDGGRADFFSAIGIRAARSEYRVSFRSPPSAVPEPTSAALLGLSLLGLSLARRRVKR